MGEFTILCGATGTGKTALLANISASLLCQKVPHFVASVETGYADFVRRVVSALLDFDINDGSVYSRKQTDEWTAQVYNLFTEKILNLSVIDNRMSMAFLIQKLKYANEMQGCKIALLDNINFFLDVKSAENTLIEMDRAVHELVMFCKRVKMHLILVMHPKKTDSGRVLSEFDIKGSSTAVQEAHNVFLFNRLEKIDTREKLFQRELKAAKLRRRGKYAGVTLLFDGATPSYREIDFV